MVGDYARFLSNLFGTFLCAMIEIVAYCSMSSVRFIFGPVPVRGSVHSFQGHPIKRYSPKYKTPKLIYKTNSTLAHEIDEGATVKNAQNLTGWNLSGEELIEKTKELIKSDFGVHKTSLLSKEFRFVAPVVGPLSKDEFLEAFASFKIREAIPDLKDNHYNFHVDPFEPNRIWWLAAPEGTHTGNVPIPPTDRKISWPPQANSVCFNSDGSCYQLTVGYCIDKQRGNTGGLGAVFGLAYAIGYPLPIREGKAWFPSPTYRLFVIIGQSLRRVKKLFSSKKEA